MKTILVALCAFPLVVSGFEISIEALGDYRQDEVSFDTKSIEEGSVFTDQAKYDQIRIWEVGGRATIGHCGFFGLFEGKYGWIDSGEFTLLTISDDESEGPSNIHSRTLGGETYDLTAGVGYNFSFCDCRLGFAPLLGYSYYHNDYHFTRGTLAPLPEGSTIEGFDIHYCNHFSGPWVGFNAYYFVTECLRVFGEFRYEWLSYGGNITADLDFDIPAEGILFSNLQEFSQKMNTHGPFFKVGADWYFTTCFYAGALFEYRNFCGNNGREDSSGIAVATQNGVVVQEELSTGTADLTKLRTQTYLVEVHVGFNF